MSTAAPGTPVETMTAEFAATSMAEAPAAAPAEDGFVPEIISNTSEEQDIIDKYNVTIPDLDLRIRSSDVANNSGTMWLDINKDKDPAFRLSENLYAGLRSRGMREPSPVQASSLPLSLTGNSVVGMAKNGTGKSMCLVLPALHGIDTSSSHLQAVIIANTHELAMQLASDCISVGKFMDPPIRVCTVRGNTPLREDIHELKKTRPHVIAATCGRLHSHLSEGIISFEHVKVFAVDEVDAMTESTSGIETFNDIRATAHEASLARQAKGGSPTQVVAFSATMNKDVQEFMDSWGTAYNRVSLQSAHEGQSLKGITQYYQVVKPKNKVALLEHLLTQSLPELNQCMIFTNSRESAEQVCAELSSRLPVKDETYATYFIHGASEKRDVVFDGFRRGDFRFLVTSDMLSRGIDNQNLNVTINFDVPMDPESYLHRVGRGGRFGHRAVAVTFVESKEELGPFAEEFKCDIRKFPMKRGVPASQYAA